MKPKVYIDGKEGTTGLQIYDRLAARADIELLLIDEDKRKDPAERKKFLNEADLVFLCLPDDAAREAVSMVENPATRIIDASTAHRTAQDWAYGFPELSQLHRALICKSKRVSNPGCHATGFISSVYPLSAMGVLPKDYPLTCFSLTGYSGGGKKMIAEYEGEKGGALYSPRIYGLNLRHKHLPEMQLRCGLTTTTRAWPPRSPSTTTCSPAARVRRRFGRRWRITTETRLSSMWRPWAERPPCWPPTPWQAGTR